MVDPIQHALIPAHVTLCREDEVDGIAPETLQSRLEQVAAQPVTLRFGRPEPFHDHGIVLPCIEGEPAFRALRAHVLGRRAVRDQKAHITLAHPRNPRAEHNDPVYATVLLGLLKIQFREVRLIEQLDGSPWSTVAIFALGA